MVAFWRAHGCASIKNGIGSSEDLSKSYKVNKIAVSISLMLIKIQKVSNYGTSSPAVARTSVQGCEILGFFAINEEQREKAKIVLHELQRKLVRCVEVRDQIAAVIADAHRDIKNKGFIFQSDGQAVTLPSIIDLQSKAESFLQSAKLAIGETARLIMPFYGVKCDHRFHRFADWAETQFGSNDTFVQIIKGWEPWIKRIVDMRNAVDHPEDKPGGKLITQNFGISGTNEALVLVDPTWCLLGEPEGPILPDMDAVIEGIIQLGEEILICLFYKLKKDFPLKIYEISNEERDPSCPVRLRVGFEQAPIA